MSNATPATRRRQTKLLIVIKTAVEFFHLSRLHFVDEVICLQGLGAEVEPLAEPAIIDDSDVPDDPRALTCDADPEDGLTFDLLTSQHRWDPSTNTWTPDP